MSQSPLPRNDQFWRVWAEGNAAHRDIELFFGPASSSPRNIECRVLQRERSTHPVAPVTPLVGRSPFSNSSSYSSLVWYFEARRLDREFTPEEIAEALQAYHTSLEYTAPILSSRGILWPFPLTA